MLKLICFLFNSCTSAHDYSHLANRKFHTGCKFCRVVSIATDIIGPRLRLQTIYRAIRLRVARSFTDSTQMDSISNLHGSKFIWSLSAQCKPDVSPKMKAIERLRYQAAYYFLKIFFILLACQ